MTYDEERIETRSEQTVATQPTSAASGAPAPAYGTGYGSVTEQRIVRSGGTVELARRVVIFVFGLVQLLLVVRVVLLLLNAREGNDIVSLAYNISDPLVDPFRGILGRDVVARGGTFLDGAALVALVGWTVLEMVVIALLRVFRRNA